MLVLVSFGTEQYRASLEYLRYTALRVGGFERVLLYGEADVEPFTGHGDYAWKPAVILKALQLCEAGDWLVYADATTALRRRFPVPAAEGSHAVLYTIGDARRRGYTQRAYTKPACLAAMGVSPAEQEHLQLNAAVQAYRVGAPATKFVGAYEAWCRRPDAAGHDPDFPNHRHDQSVLTVLAHRDPGVALADDPTQHGPDPNPPFDHHRRILPPMQTLTVVTPTTGDLPALTRCMRSVQAQDVVALRHLVVCDGPAATAATAQLRRDFARNVPVQWIHLPERTGAGRWNGHRVYGASAFLAQAAFAQAPSELLAFLDEDNWYAPDHLRGLLDRLLDEGADAAFSLRTINDPRTGELLCHDNCESLGNLAPASAGGYFLGDTSCWLLRHRTAVATAHCWDVRAREAGAEEADRALTRELLARWKVTGVARHTLHYSAGSSGLSVDPAYFRRANAIHRWSFGARPDLYLYHMTAARTAEFFGGQFDTSRSRMLDEWNMGQPRALHRHFNLIDGYACGRHVPRGATVLVHMCQPDEAPLALLAERRDLRRLLYTAESPNIRHRRQWEVDFLRRVADVLLTYWRPLLSPGGIPARAVPHQCHHLDEDNAMDEAQLRQNRGRPGTVGVVLENRTSLAEYRIDGRRLSCLDGLRQVWARRLAEQGLEVTVHGAGWAANGPWTVGGTAGKYADTRHAVDILQGFSACLVVENCDAEGYVSEKAYDALIAGAVPIFFNGHRDTCLPDEVYFNLADGPAITPAAIAEKRQAVYALRGGILRSTSAQAYARQVVAAAGMKM